MLQNRSQMKGGRLSNKLVNVVFVKSNVNVAIFFLLAQLTIYIDRGLIPGAHNEFLEFLGTSKLCASSPEVFLGILQGSFIGGLSVSSVVLSYFSAKFSIPVVTVTFGLGIFLLSAITGVLAGVFKVVSLLFFARTLSGVGEGAFVALVAPLLIDAFPAEGKGMLLGCFYGIMPIGTALGFILGSSLVSMVPSLGWISIFIVETVMILPSFLLLLVLCFHPSSVGQSPFAHFAQPQTCPSAVATETPRPLKLPQNRIGDAEAPLSEKSTLLQKKEEPNDHVWVRTSHEDEKDSSPTSHLRHRRTTAESQLSPERFDKQEDAPPSPLSPDNNLNPSAPHTMCVTAHTPPSVCRTAEHSLVVAGSNTICDARESSFPERFDLPFWVCLGRIATNPVFLSIVLSLSAQSATMASLITFGSPLLMNLGFFETQVASSTVMGVAAAFSGLIGTVIGGYVLARLIGKCGIAIGQNGAEIHSQTTTTEVNENNIASQRCATPPRLLGAGSEVYVRTSEHRAAASPAEEEETKDDDLAAASRLTSVTAAEAGHTETPPPRPDRLGDGRGAVMRKFGVIWKCGRKVRRTSEVFTTQKELRYKHFVPWEEFESEAKWDAKMEGIGRIMLKMMPASFSAAMVLMIVPLLKQRVIFLLVLALGLLTNFISQAAINLCVMMTVPDQFRGMMISLTTFSLHLFGDVPGPIFIGRLKDVLAPHCVHLKKLETYGSGSSQQPFSIIDTEFNDPIVFVPPTAVSAGVPSCESERSGLLWTIFIDLSLMHFVWIGMLMAAFVCATRYRKIEVK